MKRMLLLCLALGVSFTAVAAAQGVAPKAANAQLDTRSVRSGLARAIDEYAAGASPSWVGYTVDGTPGDYNFGDGSGPGHCGTVYLEGRRASAAKAPEPRPLAILLRVEGGTLQKVRQHAPDCELDAGGLPLHWLTDVNPVESVEMLAKLAGTLAQRGKTAATPASAADRARVVPGVSAVITAIALHATPAAVDVLIRMAKSDTTGEIRKQAIFWLGQKAGAKAVGTLADTARDDPETAIKERAVFALSRLPNGEGVDKLIEVAGTNRDPAVRKRAIFWLAQSNDPRALDYLLAVLKK